MSDDSRFTSLASLVAAALIGIAAGMAGALLVSAYVLPPAIPDIGLEPRPTSNPQPSDELPLQTASDAVVRVFDGSGMQIAGGRVFPPTAQLASGMVLTADGWLATDRAAIPDRLVAQPSGMTVVTQNGRALTVERVVEAPGFGLLFIKTAGGNLPVVTFGDSRFLEPGSRVFVPGSQATAYQPVAVVDPAYRDAAVDTPETTATFFRRLSLSTALAKTSAGAPVFAPAGEALGLVLSPGRTPSDPSRAMPVEIVRALLSEVVTRGKVEFTDMGVSGMPLAALTVVPDGITGRSGWVVTAVRPGADQHLKVGDVVRSVGSDGIDGRLPFAELFVSYPRGADMELRVLREGQDIRVPLRRP